MKTFRRSAFAVIVLTLLVGLALSKTLVHFLTDIWWFDAVGYLDTFWTRITWQIGVWIVTFAAYFLFLLANYRVAMYFTRDRSFDAIAQRGWEDYTRLIPYVIVAFIAIFAFLAAGSSVSAWDVILKFLNPTEFDSVDPIFERDVGFYIFRLPFWEGLQNWLFTLVLWGLIVAVVIYVLKGVIDLSQGLRAQSQGNRMMRRVPPLLTGNVKVHLSGLLTALAVLIAADFFLQRYDLLYSTGGVVFGAGYTDANARLQAYWFMVFATLALAALFIATLWRRTFRLATTGMAIYAIAYLLVVVIYPWGQQRFIVEPNELAKERPYIANNIALTNAAYDLEGVERRGFPAEERLTQNEIADNEPTIRNIRLWDYRPLLSTYRQLQEIRPYYRFPDVDIDRYTLNGNYRQVMLAPRELDYDQVPEAAQTWVNERLKYTHGFGLVMNPVNQVTPEGLPEFFIRNIPPVSEVDLPLEEMAIYYGQETAQYILTGMSTEEFDYPQGSSNAYTTYDGVGGVPVPGFGQRLAYAYDFGSLEILISNYFTADSRIHYRRQIRDRIRTVAPFLKLDSDPYITVIDGRMRWIVDAYTTSTRYPYSEPVAQTAEIVPGMPANAAQQVAARNVNYIRNSVKVVVDAFDGTMRFFVVDETDPVLATYRKIFPGLFKAKETIPPDIWDHFRYPLDLFKAQSQVYLLYHMTDPEVFYNREDLWRFPTEVYEGNEQLMEPYYIIMRLPERETEEFILILPFVPVNRDNMIAWMAGRSDGENYGDMLLYEFPKQQLVYGPSQIEARIDQNPDISQQLTLWSQEGSRVIRGDLLVIPIEESLLYVEPVYLRAEQGELPELRRVIVTHGEQVVMRETLEQSIAAIFGEPVTQPTGEPAGETPVIGPEGRSLVDAIAEAYRRSQTALDQRDWQTYGEAQQELEQLIQQLQQQAETRPQ
jgi:hypothetical protein